MALSFYKKKIITDLTSNEKRTLNLVFNNRFLTQAQITQITNLTQQSVSRIVSGLLEKELLIAGDRISSGRRGQPSPVLRISPTHKYAFGAAIMSDALSAVLVDFEGNICAERFIEMPSMGQAIVKDTLHNTLEDFTKSINIRRADICGMGVGITGTFTTEHAAFNTPLMLEEWALVDIEELLENEFEMPVWAENDGNVAALGEGALGVGRQFDNFAYIYIATGVGGGVISDRELNRGRFGNAGEFVGVLPINTHPFPNLELLRQIICKNGVQIETVTDLVQNYDNNWPGIEEWIVKVRDSLSMIASAASAILDTEAIVLGGRIPRELAERVIPHIEFFDLKRRFKARPTAELVAAQTQGDATAIGAAILPLKNIYFS